MRTSSLHDIDLTGWMTNARAQIRSTTLGHQVETLGCVEQVSDGIAKISGLQDVGLNELVTFEGGQKGYVLILDYDEISVVILDNSSQVESGDSVSGSGHVFSVPVGEALLGRVVNPQGNAMDNLGLVRCTESSPAERAGPAIMDRALVKESVHTGVLVWDALFALGRGQRELIIGDRGTGRTSLAVDAIVSQKDTDMICVYVAIGQRSSDVERTIDAIRRKGALDRCIVVVAGPAEAHGIQWLAPFAAMTMAEYFRDRGQHVLIVLDDLTHHAATHRELALLTNQPPGREAFPGDIFYVHARLLERAARLHPTLGGGSITALPIAETSAGNLSTYIPTNLISITDGQIVLDSHLFASGQRPAVNVGLSVSRIGGKAQSKAMRRVAGQVRMEYAQFLELETFTRFGGFADDRIKARVVRGRMIRALLSQLRFSPLQYVHEMALLWALDAGDLDALPVDKIETLRTELPEHLDTHLSRISQALSNRSALSEDETNELVKSVKSLVDAIVLRSKVEYSD